MSNSSSINHLFVGTDLTKIGKKLYLNEKTADAHFSFGEEDGTGTVKRVAAHKSVLAAGSDVFEAMFYGDLKETGDVQVVDASEAAFMEFLQFFYLDRVKLTMENIVGVMHLGHKYNIPKCIEGCVRFLKCATRNDNIFIVLNLAILYDQQELLNICETFITLNTAEIFQTIGFLDCDRKALAHILQLNVLSCSEVIVFQACMAWARAKSKQNTLTKAMVKKHLSDLYYEIRFKSMTVQQLCSLQTEYEPVLRSDFATITNMIVNPEFQAEKFNNEPRHAKWDADAIINCDRSSNNESDPFYCQTKESTTFSAENPLLLGGFICSKIRVENGSSWRDLKSDLPVDVEISEFSSSNGSNASVLLTMRTKLKSSNFNQIVLPHPILIRPKFRYMISIGPFPDQHFYYSEVLEKRVWLNYKFTTVEFHNCSINSDGKVIDFISHLNFNSL